MNFIILNVLLLLLLLLALMLTPSVHAGFIQTPTSLNLTLGSQPARFHCRAVATYVFWRVNDSTTNEFGFDVSLNDGEFNTIMHIPSTEKNNNTKVECGMFVRGKGEAYSEPAFLRIQGLLATPSNFEVTPMQEIVLLTWHNPFSLDLTDIVQDLWYTIEILNITNDITPLSCTVCPLYSPAYNFSVNEPNPCHVFTFRVTAINGAGNGNSSEFIHGYFLDAPIIITADDINVTVTLHTQDELEIKLIFPAMSCPGRNPECFHVYMESQNGYHYSFVNLTSADNNLQLITLTISSKSMPLKQLFNATVQAENSAGKTNFSGHFEIYTYPTLDHDKIEVAVSVPEDDNKTVYLPQPSSVPGDKFLQEVTCDLHCIIGMAVGFGIMMPCVAVCCIAVLRYGLIKCRHRRDDTSSKSPVGARHAAEVSLKQNPSYQQHKLGSKRHPPPPLYELERCPAYGVIVRRQQ